MHAIIGGHRPLTAFAGTAVEVFSERLSLCAEGGETASYRDLIPLEMPRPGEQYAFEVDLDACTGCKACVMACHSLNGLDAGESWRSVGLLVGRDTSLPFQQAVTTACHHCVDPACLKGCPVDAYEKDPVTGIVIHLDDQCIGCRYCTLSCPYEVPQFNDRLGIVRKCDMCADRLAAGEAPACAEACPGDAIRIRVVDIRESLMKVPTGPNLPTVPDPAFTVPTTRYLTRHTQIESSVPADYLQVAPADGHRPLVAMLALSQLAVGTVIADAVARIVGPHRLIDTIQPALWAGVVAVVSLAMGASLLHLGRPRYAYRAVIGFRHSWLSREIVVFGAFASACAITAIASWHHAVEKLLDVHSPDGLARYTFAAGTIVACLTGIAGVVASVMIYAATGRVWWRFRHSAPKSALTLLGAGACALLVGVLCAGRTPVTASPVQPARILVAVIVVAMTLKLSTEASVFLHRESFVSSDLARTAWLLRHDLRGPTRWRFLFGLIGGIAMPLIVFSTLPRHSEPGMTSVVLACVALVDVMIGEVIERSLFFRAVAAPRMPGQLP